MPDVSKMSMAERLAMMPKNERDIFFADLDEDQMEALLWDSNYWLRPHQKIKDGDWRVTALICGRGWGKLASISTPIPTPDGWRLLGDIATGDRVFDEYGKPCNVTQAHPIQFPKKAYKLTFSDGHTITCGEEHLWTTWTHRDRKTYNRRNEYNQVDDSVGIPDNWPEWTKNTRWGTSSNIGPKVRSTQEIVDTFRQGKRKDLNHSIPVLASPLQYPEKDLPIDPYVYGAWLGDGTSRSGEMTSHIDESDWLVGIFSSRGYTARKIRRESDVDGDPSNCNRITFDNLSSDLRNAEVIGNKNVLDVYRYGSEIQRRDLLAGLLDTDGFADKSNQYIEFCSKRKDHAELVRELAMSLGQKPRIYEGEATLYGKKYGTKYRVQWRPTENFFYMPRKSEVFKPLNGQASRTMHRMIVNFEEVPQVPMRCLSVDSPNNLFLLGEGMIPTHNTRAMSEWVRKKATDHPNTRIALAGRTAQDVRNILVLGESGILNISPEDERPEYKQHMSMLVWPNGSTAQLLSSEAPGAARGPQFHFACLDEFASFKTTVDDSGATLYSNLDMATRLRFSDTTPQLLMGTTPKRTQVMKELIDKSMDPDERIVVVNGSTKDNTSLPKSFVEDMYRKYGNSDLGKQELEGHMLSDINGVLFTQEMMDRAKELTSVPRNLYKIVSVDPAMSSGSSADNTGIMVVGSTVERDIHKRTAYILEDYSIQAGPSEWTKRVVEACKKHNTNHVVIEANQGGELNRMVLQQEDPDIKVHLVYATTGKLRRAEPLTLGFMQGRIKFVGDYPALEDQFLFYDPETSKFSPGELDAAVWGLTAFLVNPPKDLNFGALGVSTPTTQKTQKPSWSSLTRNGKSTLSTKKSRF